MASSLELLLFTQIQFLLNRPRAVIYQGAIQSIPNSAFTAITFDQSVSGSDNYNGHNNVTNNSRYTAQIAGWYDLDGAISYAANANQARDGAWAKNGAQITTPSAGVITGGFAGFSTTLAMPGLKVFLNVGDYVELWAFQSSGGALNTNISTFTSYMSITWSGQ